MTKRIAIEEVAEELLESIVATPKRQRRLLSKTFWNRFGYRVRSKERVDRVWATLRQRGIIVSVAEGEFGTEDKKDWIVLSFVEPDPASTSKSIRHDDSPIPELESEWFDSMIEGTFASEREVEYYFVIPLMEKLGFDRGQCAVGHRVVMYEGTRRVQKEADLVVFATRKRENALIVVEAKRIDRPLTDDVAGQAKAYALWLQAPYYMLTNGDDIRIYHFRGPWHADVPLLALRREELREKWKDFYRCLNRETVLEFKERLKEHVQTMPVS